MIKRIQMVNWRAYTDTTVEFGPGITFLMGANGAGKTSILEAIIYGLTGEVSTVTDRRLLLLDPERSAAVYLTLEVGGHEYEIMRVQTADRAGDASLCRRGVDKPLAISHKRVTEQVEHLVGVSADFLQRIVYMAEGDVFRFLSQPPGKAVDSQIRQVLGLTQLDEFLSALRNANKVVNRRIKSIQTLLDQLPKLGILTSAEFAWKLADFDRRLGTLITEFGAIEKQLDQHARQRKQINNLWSSVQKCLGFLQESSAIVARMQTTDIVTLVTELEKEQRELQTRTDACALEMAHLQGQEEAYQRVLDLLATTPEPAAAILCPVCGKPLSHSERNTVITGIEHNIATLQQQAAGLSDQKAHLMPIAKSLVGVIGSLGDLQRQIGQVDLRGLSAAMTVTAVQARLQALRDGDASRLDDLHSEADRMREEIEEQQKERAQYLSIQNGLEQAGFGSMEEVQQGLVELETRSLSLRAAQRAADRVYMTQRNVDIQAIYAQVAQVWGVFAGRSDWEIELNAVGAPILHDRVGHEFELSQFSGGEKTALLVILHTIIAHHFSRSDFLLVDEPLEHLDPVNRRSLLRFLVDAHSRDTFRQAIIATFEESLIRKYMSDEAVHVVHL